MKQKNLQKNSTIADLRTLLESEFNEEIAKHLIDYYQCVIDKFSQSKWEESISAGGKFSEVGRRILDLELFGEYKSFSKSLPRFDDKSLSKYENQEGDRSYRLLIPRVLKVIYDIRSKRGVVHASDISPNEMDATFLLYSVKWVLAEFIRLKSSLAICETKSLVEAITERETPLIWRQGDITRVLSTRIPVRDKILLLLSHFSDSKTDKMLFDITQYSNFSRFKKYLIELHKKALIEYSSTNNLCTISPTGIEQAERIVKDLSRLK